MQAATEILHFNFMHAQAHVLKIHTNRHKDALYSLHTLYVEYLALHYNYFDEWR